jgi:antitoxin (DNA-binding transcriptional repressor) of toxin-antitoxin stability system
MKRVKIAELKAQLSKHLAGVRRGHPLTVLDRETPIAIILPYREEAPSLSSRAPLRPLRGIRLPARAEKPVDSLQALLEERGDR